MKEKRRKSITIQLLFTFLQVTWRSMQEEFIRQYKHIEDLIARCYPGANVNLEFSINEVLQYFSDIAQSH